MFSSYNPMALRLLVALSLLILPAFSFPQCIQISTPSYRPTYDNNIPDDAGLWNITGIEYVEIRESYASLTINLTLAAAELDITCAGEAEGASWMSQRQSNWTPERMDERVLNCRAKNRPDFTGTLTPNWFLNNLNITIEANWACDGTRYYDPYAKYAGNQTAEVLGTLPFACARSNRVATDKNYYCPPTPKTTLDKIPLSTSIGFEPILRAPSRSCAARSFLHPEFELWNLTALTPKKKQPWHEGSTMSAISVVFGNRADDGFWRCDLSGMDNIPPSTDVMLAEVRKRGDNMWWYRCHVWSRGPSAGVETWVAFDPSTKVFGIDHRWDCDYQGGGDGGKGQVLSFHSVSQQKLNVDCAKTEGLDEVACGPLMEQVIIPATISEPTGKNVPEQFQGKHDDSYTLDRSIPGCSARSKDVAWTVTNAQKSSGCKGDGPCNPVQRFDLNNKAINYTTSCQLGQTDNKNKVVICDLETIGNAHDLNGIVTKVGFDTEGKKFEVQQSWYCNDKNPLDATLFTAHGSTTLAECNMDKGIQQICWEQGANWPASKVDTVHLPQDKLGS